MLIIAKLNAKTHHWVAELADLEHGPGKANIGADALSRVAIDKIYGRKY